MVTLEDSSDWKRAQGDLFTLFLDRGGAYMVVFTLKTHPTLH